MKNLSIRSSSCLLIACCALSSSPAAAQDGPELEHFRFQVERFDAPSIDQGFSDYVIYLPKSWMPATPPTVDGVADDRPAPPAEPAAATERYPLAIWLHGMNENYRRFHDNGGPETLDRLRAEGKIDDMVFVAVSATRRPVYLNGLTNGDFEDLIVEDLLSHLEERYPVATDAKHRAIMGVSIGGMGAMTMALNSDKFATVATHSACVLPATFEEIPGRMGRRIGGMAQQLGIGAVLESQSEWDKVSTLARMRKIDKARLDTLNIYFDAGDADRYGFGPANQALHEALEERGVHHSFELVEDGGHSWGSGSTQRQLPKSLAFVGASFRGERPAVPKSNADVPSSQPTRPPSGDK